jgi:hypothetical protein
MNFEDFIKTGQAKKAEIDRELARSLIQTADEDLIYLKSVKLDKFSARKVISNYYDVLRSILEAISILEGYKIYSHEAFTYFLKQKGEENLSNKFDRFRQIRNKINYYGKKISIEEAEEYTIEIQKLIQEIKLKFTEVKS